MTVAFFDIKNWEKEYLTKKLAGFDLTFFSESLTPENVLKISKADIISVFIYSKLNAIILSKLPNLKLISTRSTGFDHIDMEYCKNRGIEVSTVPQYGSDTVAEHSFALLLALTRRVVECVDKVRAGNFNPEGLTGTDLKGKILGVVGTGKIGTNVIKIANGFSMNVLAYDVNPDKEKQKDINFKYVSLDELLKKADIVTLHIPYCDDTHHLINREKIALMKEGAFLINTSRGGLIETDALFDGVQSGKLAGVGLDVLEEENFVKEEAEVLYRDTEGEANLKTVLENHVLMNLPNVIITPHNAFNSKEALQRILDTTVENITQFKNV